MEPLRQQRRRLVRLTSHEHLTPTTRSWHRRELTTPACAWTWATARRPIITPRPASPAAPPAPSAPWSAGLRDQDPLPGLTIDLCKPTRRPATGDPGEQELAVLAFVLFFAIPLLHTVFASATRSTTWFRAGQRRQQLNGRASRPTSTRQDLRPERRCRCPWRHHPDAHIGKEGQPDTLPRRPRRHHDINLAQN